MLKVQVSIPEMKAQAEAIGAMARDPRATLQALVGDVPTRFLRSLNEAPG